MAGKDAFCRELKKALLEIFENPSVKSLRIKEIRMLLGLTDEDRELLEYCLSELVKDKKLSLSKRGRYSIYREEEITGTFTGHRGGFGFVEPEDGSEDIFIPASRTHGAMHRDKVRVAIKRSAEGSSKRREGEVYAVISHGMDVLVGTFEKCRGFGFVIPDDRHIPFDIYIAQTDTAGAADGQKVVCTIKARREGQAKPEGKITKILGFPDEKGVDTQCVMQSFGLAPGFTEETMSEAAEIPASVDETDAAGRQDMRGLFTVTVDDISAKDLDDAISAERTETGYRLYVHIADVSHYVREGSGLDIEALSRGTSVYLVDTVVPMLPKALSNGICSLNQGVDRLTISCIMDISADGSIVSQQILPGIIRVDKRMTYDAVDAILAGEEPEGFDGMQKEIQLMHEISLLLRAKRNLRGAVDFDTAETKVVLDENGRVADIRQYERHEASKIIEDFMLAANETVAEYAFWRELPFVYRNHGAPEKEKLLQLARFVGVFGYSLRPDAALQHPKALSELLKKCRDSRGSVQINRLALRSMRQAEYGDRCMGHYGLAAKYYTHFTSPIRRYPDLMVHRLLRELVFSPSDEEKQEKMGQKLADICRACSKAERNADEAERELVKRKKCEYMQERIGQEYDAVISNVTAHGFFAELENTVSGFVHVDALKDDYYILDEERQLLLGERCGHVFCVGDDIRVRVDSVNMTDAEINFTPCHGAKSKSASRQKQKKDVL